MWVKQSLDTILESDTNLTNGVEIGMNSKRFWCEKKGMPREIGKWVSLGKLVCVDWDGSKNVVIYLFHYFM